MCRCYLITRKQVPQITFVSGCRSYQGYRIGEGFEGNPRLLEGHAEHGGL